MRETEWKTYNDQYDIKSRYSDNDQGESIKSILLRDKETQEEYGWYREPVDMIYIVEVEQAYMFGENHG